MASYYLESLEDVPVTNRRSEIKPREESKGTFLSGPGGSIKKGTGCKHHAESGITALIPQAVIAGHWRQSSAHNSFKNCGFFFSVALKHDWNIAHM